MIRQLIDIDTIETSHSDHNQHSNIFGINTSTYSISRTAGYINHRIDQASKRVNNLDHSHNKSTKRNNCTTANKNQIRIKYAGDINDYNACQLDFGDNDKKLTTTIKNVQKQHQESIQQRLQAQNNSIRVYKDKIEKLQDTVCQLDRKQITQEEKYLKMEKKYILQINRLYKLLDSNEQKQLQFQRSKLEWERSLNKQKNRTRKLQQQIQMLRKNIKKQNKNQQAIKKLRKKYLDAHGSQKGQIGQLIKDLDKNLLNLITNDDDHSNMHKKTNLLKFFDKQHKYEDDDDQNNKQNIWNQNINPKNGHMISSIQTQLPHSRALYPQQLKVSRLLIQQTEEQTYQISRISRNKKTEIQEDLYRMLLIQANTIENYTIIENDD